MYYRSGEGKLRAQAEPRGQQASSIKDNKPSCLPLIIKTEWAGEIVNIMWSVNGL